MHIMPCQSASFYFFITDSICDSSTEKCGKNLIATFFPHSVFYLSVIFFSSAIHPGHTFFSSWHPVCLFRNHHRTFIVFREYIYTTISSGCCFSLKKLLTAHIIFKKNQFFTINFQSFRQSVHLIFLSADNRCIYFFFSFRSIYIKENLHLVHSFIHI